jgi:hypothetical protein
MDHSAKQSAEIQSVLFPELFSKPVEVKFDALHQSSDGGALLLGGLDYTLGLSRQMVAALVERRQAGKIAHPLEELLRGAIYRLCCNYDDLNDADKLGRDPLFQFLCRYKLESGQEAEPLASGSTVCRWVNQVSARELLRLGQALMDWQLEHQRRVREHRVRTVTIDLDPTDDPAYGQQQFIRFNAHYGNYVYLPLLAFVTFHDEHGREEDEQCLVAALLRPGDAAPLDGARAVLRRLIRRLRELFPGVAVRVRLDGGFAGPAMLDFLDSHNVKYLINLPPNSVLRSLAEPLMAQAREQMQRSGQSARVYGEGVYAAGTWRHRKRVIIKAEVLVHETRGAKDNCRFVVTNFSEAAEPERLYKHTYCVRGDTENRIKEIHEVALGRTSCTDFWANQLRVLLAAGAYMLMQELRRRAAGTPLARAQVGRLRECLLKIGATVRQVCRKVHVSLPAACPFAAVWCQIARSLFAPGGLAMT